FKNGLAGPAAYDAGRRLRSLAPHVLLAGSSPGGDDCPDGACDSPSSSPTSSGGHFLDARYYGDAPFDYVTIHSERTDGDGGWRWVRHMREAEAVGGSLDRPVVQ